MANHLHGLASHYDEMTAALKDNETGIEIGEEDLLGACLAGDAWHVLIWLQR